MELEDWSLSEKPNQGRFDKMKNQERRQSLQAFQQNELWPQKGATAVPKKLAPHQPALIESIKGRKVHR